MIRNGAKYGTRERILSTMKVEVHRVSNGFMIWKLWHDLKQSIKMFFRRERKRIIVVGVCLIGTALCTSGIMANVKVIKAHRYAVCYRGGGNLAYDGLQTRSFTGTRK